ncbi:MAG: hypothetical protein ACRYFX_08685 [Janthinobacterium lividum]
MFTKLRALLGLDDKADVSAITDEQMTQAEATIAQLETDKTAAEGRASTAEATLATTATSLATAEGKVATLEAWKKEQKATDGREEDESNALDQDQAAAQEPWEKAAASAVASAKRRVGEK